MHSLILTCAGQSTRYKGYKDKFKLTHPSGNLMACESIKGLTGYDKLYVVISLRQIVQEDFVELLIAEFEHADLMAPEVIVINETNSQVETVLEALKKADIKGSFTVKDCDNYFVATLGSGNRVATCLLDDSVVAANKSFVSELGYFDDIVEKKVISNLFCCGAYTFECPEVFNYGCKEGANYLSQVIKNLLPDYDFVSYLAKDYQDWGTYKEWNELLDSHSTIFCDIDGVLLHNSHRTFGHGWGFASEIKENADLINKLYESGKHYIILTTSRDENYREITLNQLKGIGHHRLIMGLPACQRILINDNVAIRGRETAKAINLERDTDLLEDLLKGKVKL